jgi:hypothetical protein
MSRAKEISLTCRRFGSPGIRRLLTNTEKRGNELYNETSVRTESPRIERHKTETVSLSLLLRKLLVFR